MANSLILNIPHASAYIPQDALDEKHREDYTQKPQIILQKSQNIFLKATGLK